jgi:hypothetical protein
MWQILLARQAAGLDASWTVSFALSKLPTATTGITCF